MIDTFLFDFDGTVADSIPGIMATLKKTREVMGVPFDLDYAKSLIGTPLVKMGVNLCGEDRAAEFVDTYRASYLDWGAEMIRYFDGMEELLKDLNGAGLTCAVVTSKRRDSLDKNLDFLKGHDLFDLLVTKESTDFFKPHPAPVEYALTGLNAEAKQAVMIGDTHYDIQCAQGAGVRTVGVTWGAEPEKELRKSRPDDIARTPEELRTICFRLAGK
ncbi:MAG: HAD family hydrolase [Clostridia bacterium]